VRYQLSPFTPGDGALFSIDVDDILIRPIKATERSGAAAEHLQLCDV
jgi:hypothetical protein